MRLRIIMCVWAIAALSAGAGSVQAEPAHLPDGPPPHGSCGPEGEFPPGPPPPSMWKSLGLNEGQKGKIEAILKTDREKNAPAHRSLDEARKQLHAAAEAPAFDEAAIRKLAARKAQLETDLLVARARVRSQINALLTPDQRAEAEKLSERPPRGSDPERGPEHGRRPAPPRPAGDGGPAAAPCRCDGGW